MCIDFVSGLNVDFSFFHFLLAAAAAATTTTAAATTPTTAATTTPTTAQCKEVKKTSPFSSYSSFSGNESPRSSSPPPPPADLSSPVLPRYFSYSPLVISILSKTDPGLLTLPPPNYPIWLGAECHARESCNYCIEEATCVWCDGDNLCTIGSWNGPSNATLCPAGGYKWSQCTGKGN